MALEGQRSSKTEHVPADIKDPLMGHETGPCGYGEGLHSVTHSWLSVPLWPLLKCQPGEQSLHCSLRKHSGAAKDITLGPRMSKALVPRLHKLWAYLSGLQLCQVKGPQSPPGQGL